ncbi:MAG: hypothetical protein ABFD90_08815 [Phycisphaerales bacterium]
MAERRMDWKPVIVLAAAGAIFLVTMLFVHRWQQSLRAQRETTAVLFAGR